MSDEIAEAITAHWGERCPDFDADCALCQVWSEYDALAARPKVKALDDTDYREIHALARDAKRLFFRGYAPCDIPIQDDFGWWVMKETERRILAALEDGQ
jgi:hypothetical protein